MRSGAVRFGEGVVQDVRLEGGKSEGGGGYARRRFEPR